MSVDLLAWTHSSMQTGTCHHGFLCWCHQSLRLPRPITMLNSMDIQLCYTEMLQVYGLPTLLLFKNGEEMQGSKREGAVNKVMLTEYLKSNGVIA